MTIAEPVSVVITVYNAAPYLGEAIDSVMNQTYAPVELVVIDDGSDDGSDRVALAYGDRLRYVRQDRGGIAAARNRGVDLAGGDFLAFLDADDRYRPEAIARAVTALEANPGREAVFLGVREFLSPDLDERARARLRTPTPFATVRLSNAMVIRRSAFLRVGKFDSRFTRGQGVDWTARAMDLGLSFEMLAEVLVERRLHAQNQGLREAEAISDFPRVLKATLDRRRGARKAPGSRSARP